VKPLERGETAARVRTLWPRKWWHGCD